MMEDIKNNGKILLILFPVVAIFIIGTIFNVKQTSHVSKQDYSDAVYGTGTLDGWSLQFDMYTNNEGENQVDKSHSIESINYEYTSGEKYKYITFQVTYSYTGLDEIGANNVEIIIPKYKIGTTLQDELYDPVINIAAGDSGLEFGWSYVEETIDGKPYYIFTNNNPFSNVEGNNTVNGMFQISYAISGDDVYIRYDKDNDQEIINTKTFNATLKLKDDDNQIKSRDKTVSLFLPKTNYVITEEAQKLQSLDGLPSGDYIWVKYYASSIQRDKLRSVLVSRNYSGSTYPDYSNFIRKQLLSDNCRIVDGYLNELEKDQNGYYWVPAIYNATFSSYKNNLRWYYYIGYPREEFNNTEIVENSTAFLTYADLRKVRNYSSNSSYLTTHELEQGNSSTITVDLSNFEVEYPGDLYALKKVNSDFSNVATITNRDKLSSDLIIDSSDIIKNYIVPTVYYTGTPLNVRIGDDRAYVESFDGTNGAWLNDNEYNFSSVIFPTFFNGNGNKIGTYEVKLFVRYANTNEYVLYRTASNENAGIFDTSRSKTINFAENNIVGFYFEIYNLRESILTDNSSSTRVNVFISYHKNDLYSIAPDGKGYMHNISYVDVYDTNNNLLNNVDEQSYFNTSYTEELKQKDINEYNRYLERDYTTTIFIPSREGYTINQSITNSAYNSSQWNGTINLIAAKYETSGFKSKRITKIDMYDLLPLGVYVDNDQNISITSCTNNNCGDYSSNNTVFTLNGESFDSTLELNNFLNDNIHTTLIYNWRNTGRTWIHISGDFSDYNFQSDKFDSYIFKAQIPINIPYESIADFGLSYDNYGYINAEPGGKEVDNMYTGYSLKKDNGSTDPDAKDINDNGSETDGIIYANGPITLLEAYSSQSTLSKTARSYTLDENGNKVYDSEWTEETLVNINGLYEYKNRLYNTTESPISNVVIYDNIETYFYNGETGEYESSGDGWKGIFNGVDTSFLTGKGYVVKTYYSTNDRAGVLKSNGFLNQDWKLLSTLDEEDYAIVKSLAFEILDSNEEPAVIPPDTTLFVTVQMKAPPTTSSKMAYNTFWSQWNAVDSDGNIVDETGGTYSLPPQIEMSTADVFVKVLDEDGNYLKDVPFQIINSKGEIVYDFSSGNSTLQIKDILADGATYTLVQQAALDGYVMADDIEFTADRSIENQTIIVRNKTTKISIDKIDTSNNRIIGSVLQVRDQAGQVIDEWTTSNSVHQIDGVLISGNTYTLKEISTVRGYGFAEDITIVVNSDGNRQTIIMTEPDTKVTIHNVDEDGNNLSGTKLRIIDSDNNVVLNWTTTDDNYEIIRQLEAGKTYTLEVEKPTDVYAYSLSQDFIVPLNGDNLDVILENIRTRLGVTKKDEENNNQAGVTLQILDKNTHNVVEEWVTTDEEHLIIGLVADKEYILHEAKSVDGYSYAEDIEFRMNRDIGTQQLVMTNDLTRVEIKKLNSDNELLEGAVLQIKDGDTVIDEWTTTSDSIHSIIGVLVANKTYTLHEVSAPNGYITVSDKQITINKNDVTTEIEMIDVKNKLTVINTDESTKDPLEGVTLQILDKDGNVIKEWISTDEEIEFEGLLDCNVEYVLHVLKPAPGYIYPNDIIFTISDEDKSTKLEISELKTSLLIRKQNMKNELLKGAKLQIIDSNNEVVYEYTTNNKLENVVGKLNIDEVYKIHEVSAPKNYDVALDITFKINETGKVMIFGGVDYTELSDNTLIVVDKDKVINPPTKYPVYIILIVLSSILSVGVGSLLSKKYSLNN